MAAETSYTKPDEGASLFYSVNDVSSQIFTIVEGDETEL